MSKSICTNNNYPLSYLSPTHRVHTDIQPILSALKHGKKRIANLRYLALCKKFNLMKWESTIIVSLIQSKFNG